MKAKRNPVPKTEKGPERKKRSAKVLFHIVTRLDSKRQEYRLSWGEHSE